MKKLTMFVAALYIGCQTISINGQDKNSSKVISVLESQCNTLQNKQKELESKVVLLIKSNEDKELQIFQLQSENSKQGFLIDSLETTTARLEKTQNNDRDILNQQIEKTNVSVHANEMSLSERTLWGSVIGVIVLTILIVSIYFLLKKIKKGNSSIDEVKKAQELLQSAQVKIQEESIKLDNKLLEVVEKQIIAAPTMSISDNTVPDHSLTLKVADEIVRIEMNLSHMDVTVKGYKQLSKAVQRIKDNFYANGYEIVDMLGKPYNGGMKVTANFIVDESLEQGCQTITGIIKPQVNFNEKMIQSAQITVSQNI